jgi:hypothetical protein
MSRSMPGALVLAAALLGAATACTEAPRTGSVYRPSVPYGPWWVHPGVYDRPLPLGRPKLELPPEGAAPSSRSGAR